MKIIVYCDLISHNIGTPRADILILVFMTVNNNNKMQNWIVFSANYCFGQVGHVV